MAAPTKLCTLSRTGGGREDHVVHRVPSQLRSGVLGEVVNNREEIVITRAGHEPVVIVSLEEYQSLRETAYLLRSPVNAQRLASAMEQFDRNDGIPRDLLDDH